jgi:endonuclease/exonuclease/phosphatase family metal-dependent hydrolase
MRVLCASVVLAWGCLACSGGGSTIDARPPSDAAPPTPDAAPIDGTTSGLPENPPEPLPTGDPAVTVVTYNTALAATIWYAPERKPIIVDKLKAIADEVDVVCLQEVWNTYAPELGSGPKEMAGLLKPEWPYAMWDYTKQGIWGSGLLIVSKHPLYRARSVRFEANDPRGLIDRMVIAADVLVEGSSYFHVMCTHINAWEDPQDLAVRQAEIAEAKAWAQTQGYFDGPTFFLGDMNCGPATAPCTGDTCTEPDMESYGMMLADWSDPNECDGGVPNIASQCTQCEATARPMQRLDSCTEGGIGDCDPDIRLDHCMYRGIGTSELSGAVIVLDDIIEVTPARGPDWEACDGGLPCTEYCGGEAEPCDPRDTQLSDHKGVKCSFAPPG